MAQSFDPFSRPELLSKTQRYREISALSAIYDGTQYDGRPDWWTGKHAGSGIEHPLRERKPCVIYRLPKAAVQQVVRFLFGEKRFPRLSLQQSEGEEQSDSWYPALSEEETELLDKWLSDLSETSGLPSWIRAICERAIACKTAVAVVELNRGEFRFTLPRPQDCYASFEDNDPCAPVTRLLWSYEFDKEVANERGEPEIKRHIFRREWDETNVYTYDDVELKQGQTIEWPKPETTEHGLGFCPVVWVRNLGDFSQGLDGESLIDGLGDEFEALDMTLSKRHQGVIYLGSPQMIETGVEPDDGPEADGHRAGPAGYSGKTEYSVAAPARRIAPDAVWTYQGKDVDVKLLETSGKAFQVGTDHVNDIRSRLLETMGVVLTSMADTVSRVTAGADMSARFLALAHGPLIALVQEYRSPWWSSGLRPILSMMMRMAVVKVGANERVMVPGTEAAVKVLTKFQSGNDWTTPRITPHWGKFFEPSTTEVKTSVEAATAAKEGGLVSSGTAVEHIAHDFGIDSPQDELERLEEEAEEQRELEEETAEREFNAALVQLEAKGAAGAGARNEQKGVRSESGAQDGAQRSGSDPGKKTPAKARNNRRPKSR